MRSTMAAQALDRAVPRYPAQLLTPARLPDGTRILVRPIRADDDALEREFIGHLSSETRYNRLLSGRRLTPEEILHLTHIDYEREMAFVAVTADGAEARILGVARYVRDADASAAEFAIVVADAWQSAGLGSHLVRELRRAAIDRALDRMEAEVLGTNRRTIALMQRLGFAIAAHHEDRRLVRIVQDFTLG